ncbi:hypothetical protein D3261_10430 [Halococcus sp. IIIV-5B]|nr:hypothetical protein D3261_10430 [Halococcus sp. IIIV-5B]
MGRDTFFTTTIVLTPIHTILSPKTMVERPRTIRMWKIVAVRNGPTLVGVRVVLTNYKVKRV